MDADFCTQTVPYQSGFKKKKSVTTQGGKEKEQNELFYKQFGKSRGRVSGG